MLLGDSAQHRGGFVLIEAPCLTPHRSRQTRKQCLRKPNVGVETGVFEATSCLYRLSETGPVGMRASPVCVRASSVGNRTWSVGVRAS